MSTALRKTLLIAMGVLIMTNGNRPVVGEETSISFPIMAWSHAPNDPAKLARIKDCGLTIAGFAAPDALDAVHAAGLQAIVQDPRASSYDWVNLDQTALRAGLESLVAEVSDHPAVYGYYLKDEPRAVDFPGLATACAMLRETAPGKWPYVNLFPNYANLGQLAARDYDDYVERFITLCRPMFLSYDHYALMEHEPLRHGYWQNLEAMRAMSLKHGIPFWNIVLSVAHFNYRVPTQADLRFEAFSTLAYGGRGLAYFTYFAPAVGNYRMAPVDQFGNETPTWYSMQNVNLQVQKLAPTLLKLTSTRVYHLGTVPEDCQGPPEGSLVKSLPGGDFLVGEFDHEDGSKYIMIVNKHVSDSFHCAPSYSIPTTKVQMVSPYSGNLVDFGGEHMWLAAGQGALLRVE